MKFEFEAIGTDWKIESYEDIPLEREASILENIKIRIVEFDKNYSRFRNDSLISKMAKYAGEYVLPDDAEMLFDAYKRIYDLTKGKVTPLIGKVMEDAGYDAEYSFRTKEMMRTSRWDEVMEYRFPKIILKRPALLDLGAGGKGYLVDIIGELLLSKGIRSFFINAGGDILQRSFDDKPLKVGLEDPDNTSKAIGIINLTNQSICGSAGNRRAWGKFHHIIDPYELESPRHILATWVMAETTLISDILSTALFFTQPEILQDEFKFEYLILFVDRSIKRSSNFDAELFLKASR